jgi:hypothetical protein
VTGSNVVGVGVPGWPDVGPGFDLTPLLVLVLAFPIARFVVGIRMSPRAAIATAVAAVALGLIAAWLGHVPAIACAIAVVASVVAGGRRHGAAVRPSSD